jgi:phosphoglycerate dehydrogenase-like enzyme
MIVLQTELLDDAAAAWLRERCELVVCPYEDVARFEALLPTADGLLIRTYTQVNEALLAKAPKLRVVARAGVGLDNVDLAACARRNVIVVSTPGANTRAVVELATSFMLDALRPRVFLDRAIEKSAWNRARKELIATKQLSDLTMGIVGFGRVGSSMARVGAALDMRVVYNDLVEIPESNRAGAVPMAFEGVLAEADVLTLHVDGRSRNRHLIDAAALAWCKRNVLLLNTCRGMVVDTSALADFLRRNTAAQAICDVHEPEPVVPANPLLGLKNAHLSPHIGAATATAHANMSWVVRDLWRVLNGEAPENPAVE